MTSVFKLFLKHPPVAWVVLVMSLFVTGWAWYIASGAVEKHASERFEFTAKDVANAITDRMNEYELALRSGLALFHASDKVSRKEWEEFADTLYLNKHFPGIQGLGYSQILKPEQVAEHEAEIQAEGFEEYQIKPAGERDMYSAIVFLEPFDWRNQRAFGYDMFSEPTRREAMERARDTADFAASGRVTLVQETEEDTQYGFLMYFPFYQQNSDLTSIQARREALQGYVYAAFRLGDLMKGVLNNAQQNINFELYEGSPEKGVLLHNNAQDKHVRFDSIEHPQRFQTTHQMNIGGQTWSLFVYSDTGFLQASELNQPSFIVVIGVLFDIVLFLLISYVVRGRNQAKDSEQRAWTDFRVSQQRLQLAADAGKMGLMEWNIIDNKLYWDDRMLALYGYNRDTIKDNIDFWQQCIHPEDLDNFRDELASARQFKQHIDMQFRIRTPQGRTKYIAASIIVERNNAGEATRMVGFNYDVTEQITNKQQIQEKNWRLQNLVDATDAGTWELNVQTGETQINYRWAEMLGYTLNDLMPVTMQTWLDLAHPDDREQTRHRMQSHFAGNANHYECVCRMRHKAGHWVWIKRRGKVFSWTHAGEPLMMFGTHHDISEQKQYEEILKTERDKAEAANRSRGEFLANMSHEIRTPINGVMGALDLLSDTDLSPSQFNLIGISRRSAESLLGLINDILDLSKIESGKLEIVEEPVELVSAMNDVARTLSTKAEAKNIALVCPSHYVDDTYVYADGLRLRQILTNLINNAIKFTKEGSVLVDLNVLDETNTNVHLRFNVTDTGQGIPYDKQKTLFERFQQVDSSLTRKEGGSGLGLAISKQLIDLMGGRIGVVSGSGQGSTFWFELTLNKTGQRQDTQKRLFDDMQVCVLRPQKVYQEFYQTVFDAWKVEYRSTDDLFQLPDVMPDSLYQHKALIIDAEQLTEDKTLVDNLVDCRERIQGIHIIVACPQSMLGSMPKQISSQADQVISKPIDQSELYNVLLTIATGVIEKSPTQPMGAALPEQFDALVLVVEDNTTNVAIIQGLLMKFNVRSEVADNGQEALNLLAQSTYDLVLMDCQMPVMDGYEATEKIRKGENAVQDQNIPIIALTAHAMRGDKEACFDAGMNDYLSKPIDPELLHGKLSKWLPERCKQQLTM